MDIQSALPNFDLEVKHILGIKNQIPEVLCSHPDTRWGQCIVIEQEVTMAGQRNENIEASITDDKCFGPVVHPCGNPSPRPLPSIASIN